MKDPSPCLDVCACEHDTTERPKLPETFEEDTWKKLQVSVRAVHQQRPVDQSFEELYKAVEDLCIHKLGQNLYTKLSAECEHHIETEIAKLVCCTFGTHEHPPVHPSVRGCAYVNAQMSNMQPPFVCPLAHWLDNFCCPSCARVPLRTLSAKTYAKLH